MSRKFTTICSIISALLLFSPVRAGENSFSHVDHMQLGIPQDPDLLISRRGFALGYSYRYRQALWVSYILTADNVRAKRVPRSNKFNVDPEVRHSPVTPAEYTRSGYDRGHLAPAADMGYSRQTMLNSFLMSNISPQKPGCNREIWKHLEKQIRLWALQERKIYIVTGPVFNTFPQYIPATNLPVPQAFYKVVLDLTPPYKMAAFIVPNSSSDKEISAFAVSVDEVEKVTGMDFFNALPDDLENTLEKQSAFDQWMKKPQ